MNIFAPAQAAQASKHKPGLLILVKKDLQKFGGLYLLILPALVYYILFCYKPMYGALIAFKSFSPGKGIWNSEWVGLTHFLSFFKSYYFGRILSNTVHISLSSILWGFPAPILLALLLNEIQNERFKRVVQTITYMPHFISMVIVCGLVSMFVSSDGLIVQCMAMFGFKPISLLSRPEYFVPVYVISGIWQEIGWGTIIYLSALTSIDPGLYEAARIDGAGHFQQVLHVTLPGLAETIIIMLLLRLGSVMSIGYEKIILLYNEAIYDTADVISSFVYRKGLLNAQYSYSSAVGLFNSLINFLIVYVFNRLSRRFKQVSLW